MAAHDWVVWSGVVEPHRLSTAGAYSSQKTFAQPLLDGHDVELVAFTALEQGGVSRNGDYFMRAALAHVEPACVAHEDAYH